MGEVRIDKWLWAVRIFKTRDLAAEACRKKHVSINNLSVKPSHLVKIGQIIQVRKPPITHTYEVLSIISQRIPAAAVPQHLRDLTPPEQYELLRQPASGFIPRPSG
ncbi:MAG: RNA-binding S4 domain-containing protein, partial [Tannerellaceae bacterium]|nr:RNA-binding S4 domain-containing protein [Tannerellaceae bacterium]